MIRIKKIRGHHRIWNRIERWKNHAAKLDTNELLARKREYTKVYVYPFFSIDVINSVTPTPAGKTRSKIVHALFDIYDAWQSELEKLNKPYYLKIWYFPENVGKSQVVCAIDEMIDWYEETFYKPESSTPNLDFSVFGDAYEKAQNLTWNYAIDEISIDEEYLGESEDWASLEDFYDTRRWLTRKMKQPHREVKAGDHIYYQFPQYTVWIGGA